MNQVWFPAFRDLCPFESAPSLIRENMTPELFKRKLTKCSGGQSIITCLRDLGVLNNPEKIVTLELQDLLKERNMTRKSLLIIASLLEESGYIKDAKEWLLDKSMNYIECPNCGHKF